MMDKLQFDGHSFIFAHNCIQFSTSEKLSFHMLLKQNSHIAKRQSSVSQPLQVPKLKRAPLRSPTQLQQSSSAS